MTTGEDNWKREWRDKSTPPYEVLRIELLYQFPNRPVADFTIYYRTFQRAVHNRVRAADELGAFVEAQKLMAELRAKSEKHRNQLR